MSKNTNGKTINEFDQKLLAENNLGINESSKDVAAAEIERLKKEIDPEVERKIVRKFDLHILPCLVVMYFMNYLDRQQVAAARLKGLQEDLNLTGLEYSNVINLFFVTYIACQPFATALLAFVTKPTWFITGNMALWGIVSLCTGFATNYHNLLAIRLILGIFEAIFYPGALFTLSKFYTRNELALRSSFFYGAALLASAFGALLATGIIDGIGTERLGHPGYAYLFYIEGAFTVAFAILIFFVLPNFPSTAPFLTEEEKIVAVKRLIVDSGVPDEDDKNEPFYTGFVQSLKDPATYLLGLTWWLVTAGLAFNSYSPTLTASLNIGNSTVSLLLTCPPYILALLCALTNGWHSDRKKERCFHTIGPVLIGVVGCIIPLATTNKAARFVGIFLMTSAYAGYPIILGWVQVSFPGKPRRRASAIGFLSAFASVFFSLLTDSSFLILFLTSKDTANIAGGYFFVSSKYGPTYRASFGMVLAMFAAAVFAALATRFYFAWKNKQLDRAQAEGRHMQADELNKRVAELEHTSPAKAEALASSFRYYL